MTLECKKGGCRPPFIVKDQIEATGAMATVMCP